MKARSSHGRWAFVLTVVAFFWGVGLIGAALTVPVYSSQATLAPSGRPVSSATTLVSVNGLGVLVPVGVPALIVALVWIALRFRCTRGGRAGGVAAWSLIGLLAAFCIVGIASIGLFVAPAALLLAVAAWFTPLGGPPSDALPVT